MKPKPSARQVAIPLPSYSRSGPASSFDHAFEELSVLLGCIRHLTFEAEMENDRQAGSAARILSAFAKELVNDMERGRSKLH